MLCTRSETVNSREREFKKAISPFVQGWSKFLIKKFSAEGFVGGGVLALLRQLPLNYAFPRRGRRLTVLLIL